jgi:hypothetical protein
MGSGADLLRRGPMPNGGGHPSRQVAAQAQAALDAAQQARWARDERTETARITGTSDERILEIEMQEACNRWNAAMEVVTTNTPTVLYPTVDQARYMLVLSNHRYWTALKALEKRRRRYHRVYVIGGLVVAVVAAIAGLIAVLIALL